MVIMSQISRKKLTSNYVYHPGGLASWPWQISNCNFRVFEGWVGLDMISKLLGWLVGGFRYHHFTTKNTGPHWTKAALATKVAKDGACLMYLGVSAS